MWQGAPGQHRLEPGRLGRSERGDLWFPPHPTSDAFRASRVRGPAAHAQPEVWVRSDSQAAFWGAGSQSRLLSSEEGAADPSRPAGAAAGPPPPWAPGLPGRSSPPRSAFANRAEGITRLLGAAEPLRKCFCLCSAARFPMLLGTGSQLSCLLVCLY